MRQSWIVFGLGLFAASAWGQTTPPMPTIAAQGIVNAASYVPPGLPGSGIAQGSIFSVFGSNLGPTQGIQVSSFPLPTSNGLGGTSIRIIAGGQSLDAIMLYASAGQLAALLPSRTPVGPSQIQVTYNGQTSAPVDITVVRSTFGIFAVNQAGTGPGVVFNGNTPLNSPAQSIAPGQVAVLYGTGLGPVDGDEAAGPPPQGQVPVNGLQVLVGGRPAAVVYAGRTRDAGVDQINFTVPAGLTGCAVPVTVRTATGSSNYVTMAINSTAGACADANGLSASDIQLSQTNGGLRVGTIQLTRLATQFPPLPFEQRQDTAAASFTRLTTPQLLASNATFGLRSAPGTCTVSYYRGTTPPVTELQTGPSLDAGAGLTVTGPRGTRQVVKQPNGSYFSLLGGGDILTPQPDFLDSGAYTVTNGTTGVNLSATGAFSVPVTLPQPVTWTNQSSTNTVIRSQPLEITWSGGDPNGYVLILGVANNATTNTGAAFACTERTSAGTFTVPESVLQTLPASISTLSTFSGIYVGSTGRAARFTAPGLDIGQVVYSVLSGRAVNFQ